MQERTFVMLKPDAIERGLIGEIVSRLERKGLRLVKMELRLISPETAREHYAHHEGRDFFQTLIDYVTRGPVLPMIWEGGKAVKVVRELLGDAHFDKAAPGTIRGDLAYDETENLVHASDSVENAEIEIKRFFA